MNPAELPTIAGDLWAIGTFVVYFLVIVAIGVLASRFNSSAQAENCPSLSVTDSV